MSETSGSNHHRARYHDPRIGAWLSLDPLETANRYGYVMGDPVNMVDLSGLILEPNPMTATCEQNTGRDCQIVLAEAQSAMDTLSRYGVRIKNPCEWDNPNRWTAADKIGEARHTVTNMAFRLDNFAQNMFRPAPMDDTQIFRVVMGPLELEYLPYTDADKGYVYGTYSATDCPGGCGWLAKIDSTGLIKLSHRLFESTIFPLSTLLVHEIAHMINFRFEITLDGQTGDPEDIYNPNGPDNDLQMNEGYEYRLRSSDAFSYEVVTDAIANWFLSSFTADAAGEIRQEQIDDLMQAVIKTATFSDSPGLTF